MSQVIEVIVSADGSTQVQTLGFSGGACRVASQFLEAALGRRLSESLTEEYHQPASHAQGVQQNQAAN
jgi:DUF2997 family protein